MHSKYNRIGTHRLLSSDDMQLLVCCNFDSAYFNYETLPICYNKIGFKVLNQTQHDYYIRLTGIISRAHGYNYMNGPYQSKNLNMVVVSMVQPEFGSYNTIARCMPCLFLPGRSAEHDHCSIIVPISKFNDFVQLIKEYNKEQENARKDIYLC